MNTTRSKSAAIAVALLAAVSASAHSAIVITEVAPWASGDGNSPYLADWFELTNTGSSAVDITGWKVDDNSNLFANARALRGVTSIAAGQSVIFIEGNATGTTDADINASFRTAWFGSAVPAGLSIGNYGGSGIGLSTDGDAVNIFDAGGTLITRVAFGASTTGFSFDNAAGLSNATISQLSVAGINGAFLAADGIETGSPGVIAAVPEPETYAMMLAGLALVGFALRRRQAMRV